MDNDTHLSSGSLFHYTPTLENLKGILQSGFKPSYSRERLPFSFVDGEGPEENHLMTQMRISEWLHLKKMYSADEIDIRVAMVSFCDIPVQLSGPHAEIYGRYAIGLSKRWAEEVTGLNPVLYMCSKSHLMRSFNILWTRLSLMDSPYFFRPPQEGFSIIPEEERKADQLKDTRYQIWGYNKALKMCREIAAHVKLYQGPFSHGAYWNLSHRFYDEREWRYLPRSSSHEGPCFLYGDMPNDLKDHFTQELQVLPIDLRLVTHLLVRSQDEKQQLSCYLRELHAPEIDPTDLSKIQVMCLSEACQLGT